MSNKKTLIDVKVSELPESWLKNIPLEKYNETVKILIANSKTRKSMILLHEYLNERFVRRQLNLLNQWTDPRDIWYIIGNRMKCPIDLTGKNPFDTFKQGIDIFARDIKDFFGFDYWAYVLDELNIETAGRAVAYTLESEEILITAKKLHKLKETPFFFLICEKKQILLHTMEALREKGYDGWLGISTEGNSSSNVIRLLIEFKELKHIFYVFSFHDWDVSGLGIFFDMKRWFPVESVAMNPDFLNWIKMDRKNLEEKYVLKKATLKATETILSNLSSDPNYDKYKSWINEALEKKVELNSLTGHRLDENPTENPAKDFANYIEYLLENNKRIYNLNRYREISTFTLPRYDLGDAKPFFIDDFKTEIRNLINETIQNFLGDRDNEEYWYYKVKDLYDEYYEENHNFHEEKQGELIDLRDKMIEENKTYDGSLKKVNEYLNNQFKTLKDIGNGYAEEMRDETSNQQNTIDDMISTDGECIELEAKTTEFKTIVIEALKTLKGEDSNDN